MPKVRRLKLAVTRQKTCKDTRWICSDF